MSKGNYNISKGFIKQQEAFYILTKGVYFLTEGFINIRKGFSRQLKGKSYKPPTQRQVHLQFALIPSRLSKIAKELAFLPPTSLIIAT